MRSRENNRTHIILIGASIGKAWNLSALPERMNDSSYFFEYVHGGGWDKSARLKEITSRQRRKPDVVIIKQCAAYFPGDIELYKRLMKQWIVECREAGIIPVPSTVVPVTRLHSFTSIPRHGLRRRHPFKDGNPFRHWRAKAVFEFNDWIRSYCGKNDLSFLDLEAAVRVSKRNRYLKGDLARLDGLHLKANAYRLLDQILIPNLDNCILGGRNASKTD